MRTQAVAVGWAPGGGRGSGLVPQVGGFVLRLGLVGYQQHTQATRPPELLGWSDPRENRGTLWHPVAPCGLDLICAPIDFGLGWPPGLLTLTGVYRRTPLPSFLINYFGPKRIGKLVFLAENGSIEKIFQAKRGPNRPATG
jgi:hypothetical protein